MAGACIRKERTYIRRRDESEISGGGCCVSNHPSSCQPSIRSLSTTTTNRAHGILVSQSLRRGSRRHLNPQHRDSLVRSNSDFAQSIWHQAKLLRDQRRDRVRYLLVTRRNVKYRLRSSAFSPDQSRFYLKTRSTESSIVIRTITAKRAHVPR